jgi:hippurate hydrolase
MIRTDLDALPVSEKTGRPYASTVRTRDKSDNEVGVMHACGHDMHMTCWVGTARTLAGMKDRWSGTLMFIGQPAEEVGSGARMMLEDGLFKRFPKPDYALALHCDSRLQTGRVAYTEGLALANVDSVDITVHGRGGHGSAPHTTIDPIVIAARIVLDLQTIVSRENNPLYPCVVTVGSIHGGTKHNIIPDEVKLQLTLRTFSEPVRQQLLEGIRRRVAGLAQAHQAPDPTVEVEESTTPTINNTPLVERVVPAFAEALGADQVKKAQPLMGAEDFGLFSQGGVPICMFWIGTIDSGRLDAARARNQNMPALHSSSYFPDPRPSIATGIKAMSAAVIKLLPAKS